ncbi:hypothetical protein [Mucilaginibacter sp.]|uniref:hypothetical protein n=1 Tax=Mucilaginibacter sp. TaxID=1882438 RepID=UPI0035BC46CA
MTNNDRLELLKQTLEMLAGIKSVNNDEQIAYDLSEIEGDNYTFLHPVNLLPVNYDFKVFDSELIARIAALRREVDSLPKNLWNVSEYRHSTEWNSIKSEADSLLKKIS